MNRAKFTNGEAFLSNSSRINLMKIQSFFNGLNRSFVGSFGLGIGLVLLSPSAKAFTTVNSGTDYLVTPNRGAKYTFSDPSLGTVFFTGLPIDTPTSSPPDGVKLEWADTVVNRTDTVNADADGEITPIEIVDLSLKSDSPVNINGIDYDIFAGLQKYYPVSLGGGALSTGTMTIRDTGLLGGKTWDSSFGIKAVAIVAPTGTLVPTGADYVKNLITSCPSASYQCILFDKSGFVANDEPWSPLPSLGQLQGPNLVDPLLKQNFYLTERVRHQAPDGAIHDIDPAPGPMPILAVTAALSFTQRLRKASSTLKVMKLGK